MTTTIELAKEAGFADWYGTDDIAFLALLDIFRAIIVAERDKELLATDMEPALKWTGLVSGYSEWYSLTQLTAARLQGAEEERKQTDDWCNQFWKERAHGFDLGKRITDLEQQLAENREPLTQQQVVDAFCNLPHNVQYIGVFDAGVRFAEKHHNIGGKHD